MLLDLSSIKAYNGASIQVEVYHDARRLSPSIQVRVLSIETSRCRDTQTVFPFDHPDSLLFLEAGYTTPIQFLRNLSFQWG